MTLTADYERPVAGRDTGHIVVTRDGSALIPPIPTSSFFNIDFNEPPKTLEGDPPYDPARDGIPFSSHNSKDSNFMEEQTKLRILDMMKDANVSRGANVRNSVCPIMGSETLTFGKLDNMEVKFDQIMRASMSPYSWPKITKDSALFPLLMHRDVSKESGLDTGYFIDDPHFIENFINKIVDPAGRSPFAPNDQYFPLGDEELVLTESFLSFFGINGCSIKAKREANGEYSFQINITGLPPITKPDTPVGKTPVYWFQGNPEKNNFMAKDPRATTAIKKGLLITKEMGDLGQVLALFLWKVFNPETLYTMSTCDNVVMLQCMLLNLNCVLTSAAKEDGEKMRKIMVFRAETDPLKITTEVFDNEKKQILAQNQKFIETITELATDPTINIYMAGVTGPIVFPQKFYQEILDDLNTINAMLNAYNIVLVSDGDETADPAQGRYHVSDINKVIANLKTQYLFNTFIRKPKTQLQMNLAKKYTQNDKLFNEAITLNGYDSSTPFYLLGKKAKEREKAAAAAQGPRGGGIQKGGAGKDLAIDKQEKFKTLEFSVEPAMFYDRDANLILIDSPTTRKAILNTVLSGSDPGEYMIDYVVPFILAGGTVDDYAQAIFNYANFIGLSSSEELRRLAFIAGTAYAEYLSNERDLEIIRINTYVRKYAEVYGDVVIAAANSAVQVCEIAKRYNDAYEKAYSSEYIDAVCIVSHSKTQNMAETLKVTYLAAGGNEIFYKIFYETDPAKFDTDQQNLFSVLQTNVLTPAQFAFDQTTDLDQQQQQAQFNEQHGQLDEPQQAQLIQQQQEVLIQKFITIYQANGGNPPVLQFYLENGGNIFSFYQDIKASLEAVAIAHKTLDKFRENFKNTLFASEFSTSNTESQYAAQKAHDFALEQLDQSEEVNFFQTNFLPLTESYENIYKKTFRIALKSDKLDKALSLIDPFRGVNLYVLLNGQIMQKFKEIIQKLKDNDYYIGSDLYYDFINELYYRFYLDSYVRYDDELYTLMDEIAGEFQSALNQIQTEPETPVASAFASASTSAHQYSSATGEEGKMSVDDPDNDRKLTLAELAEYNREQARVTQNSMSFLDLDPDAAYSPSPSFASYPSPTSSFASYPSPTSSFFDDSEDESKKPQKKYSVHPAQKEEQRLLEELLRSSAVAPKRQDTQMKTSFPTIQVQGPREVQKRDLSKLLREDSDEEGFYNSRINNASKRRTTKAGYDGGGKRRTRKYKRKQKKTLKRRKQQKTRKYKRRARKTLKRRRR